MTAPRIVIADDHDEVTRQLRRLLEPDFEIVATVHDGGLVVETVTAVRPDALLLDLSMPHVNGLDTLHQLKQLMPACKVLIVTMFADATIAAEALKRGACGFVVKYTIGEELVPALRGVLEGKIYVPCDLHAEIKALMLGAVDPAGVQLTGEQLDVLRLLAGGLRTIEIAAALDIATSNVVATRNTIMQALGVHSTAELVRYATTHRLVRV